MPTAGQPTLYRPEYSAQAHNYCLLGATNEDLAGFFAVTRRTIDNWIAAHPAFASAVKEGRVVADARVAHCLYERAIGWERTVERKVLYRGVEKTLKNTLCYPPDVQACIFWLRNRRRATWGSRTSPPAGGFGDDSYDTAAALEAASERARWGPGPRSHDEA